MDASRSGSSQRRATHWRRTAPQRPCMSSTCIRVRRWISERHWGRVPGHSGAWTADSPLSAAAVARPGATSRSSSSSATERGVSSPATSGGSRAAIAPAWQPIFGTPARLAWIEGPADGIGASSDYFRGLGPAARRVAILELPSGRASLNCPGLITEGVRWSADARAALLLCRVPAVDQHALEVWYAPLGGVPQALVTGIGDLGFGYYGLQPSLSDIVAWSLADR